MAEKDSDRDSDFEQGSGSDPDEEEYRRTRAAEIAAYIAKRAEEVRIWRQTKLREMFDKKQPDAPVVVARHFIAVGSEVIWVRRISPLA